MSSPEQNIYRDTPTPTHQELREGLDLLLDTHTEAVSEINGHHQGVILHVKNRPGEVVLIDRLKEGECAGIRTFRQVSSPIDISQNPKLFENFEMINEISLCRGSEYDYTDETGLKFAGTVILSAWETLSTHEEAKFSKHS